MSTPASPDTGGTRGLPPGGGHGEEVRERRGGLGSWTDRAILAAVLLVLLVVGWLVGSAFLPLWWAQRVGDVAAGTLTAGLFAGLTCGAVFTALSLLALRPAVRRGPALRSRLVAVAVAALLAAPNLTTLAIVLEANRSCTEGRAVLAGRAPGFTTATAVGAGAAVVGLAVVAGALAARRRRRAELGRLRRELDAARRPGPDPAPDGAPGVGGGGDAGREGGADTPPPAAGR